MTHKRVDGGPAILSLAEMFEPIRATDDAGVPILFGGHQTLALGGAQTLQIPQGARYVMLQATVQNARYTLDGTTPAAAIGFQLKSGDPPRTLFLSHRTILRVMSEVAGSQLAVLYGV